MDHPIEETLDLLKKQRLWLAEEHQRWIKTAVDAYDVARAMQANLEETDCRIRELLNELSRGVRSVADPAPPSVN
jgi:hypothetical protein